MNKGLRIILPAILALWLGLVGCSSGTESSVAQVGELAPDFQAQTLDGHTISLSDLRGKPVLINFWATWCSPCHAEMPYLQQIHEEWSHKRLVVLAVNVGESPSKVEEFIQVNNLITLPVLLDINGEAAQQYGVTAFPTTFFVDRNGIVQKKVVGAFWSKEQIEGYLDVIIP